MEAKSENRFQHLLRERYGADRPEIEGSANPVVETLLSHRSVRKFQEKALPEGTLETLVAAAQSAATSSNLQNWSVIAIQDPTHKAEVATLCGDQAFIRQAPLFLVFCADLARLAEVSHSAGYSADALEYAEMFLMATIDAALAAQNAALAAESLGLGICYVGAARNLPEQLGEALRLPARVFAVFGMAIGVPVVPNSFAIKPRLSQSAVLHHEAYDASQREEAVARYNGVMRDFYTVQAMSVQGDWAQHSAKRVATPEALGGRDTLLRSIQEKGLLKR